MDRETSAIRDLARRVAEIACGEENRRKRTMWRRHNSLEKVERPPVMCRPVAWNELVPPEAYVCRDPLNRMIETHLRMRLYKAHLADDEVVEPWVDVPAVHLGDERQNMWGVSIDVTHSDSRGGTFMFRPEIRNEDDIERLRVPRWQIDEEPTRRRRDRAEEALGGILGVRMTHGRIRGAALAYWGAYLRGLEQMMYDCIDRPTWFHRFMRFLSDAHIEHMRWLEKEGHLDRNDVGLLNSVCGACSDLPRADYDGRHVRQVDCWCIGDSQEFTSVSPAMWDEFLLEHQLPIFALAGLVSYGCCESLVGKLEILRRKIPNLRRVTVSPWSDIRYSAEQCGRAVVMQIRPNPTDVLMRFDEEQMRADIANRMHLAGDCIFDFCLQDIQSVFGRPQTLTAWVRAAKEVGAELYHRTAGGS